MIWYYNGVQYFLGIIYAFNTKVPSNVAALAHEKNVPIKEHNIIYKLIDDLRDELTERLEPVEEEVVIGEFIHPLFLFSDLAASFQLIERKWKTALFPCRGGKCSATV